MLNLGHDLMRWRDIIIGAIASLLVTTLGGVAVYYFTKEPDDKKNEKLVYEINKSAEFIGGEKEISFSSFTIKNLGGVAAKNVVISLMLKEAEINDIAINSSIGLKEKSREKTKNSLKITYSNFMPNEKVTINLILSKQEKPTVDVRSDLSLGQDSSELILVNSNFLDLNKASEKIVPVSALLVLCLFLIFYIRWVKYIKGAKFFNHTSKNNAGFVLLHSGLTDQAEKIFLSAIDNGEYSQLTLSNLALCQAIKGEFNTADALLKATNFDTESKHGKAVVLFNKALIKLIVGDKQASQELLKESIQLSSKEIKRYCQLSILLDGVRSEPIFFDLLK